MLIAIRQIHPDCAERYEETEVPDNASAKHIDLAAGSVIASLSLQLGDTIKIEHVRSKADTLKSGRALYERHAALTLKHDSTRIESWDALDEQQRAVWSALANELR